METNFEHIKNLIKSHIQDAKVEINDLTGTRDHLAVEVVSDEFKGKTLIEQHKMLMDILKEKLKSEIHAVQLKTLTWERYNKK